MVKRVLLELSAYPHNIFYDFEKLKSLFEWKPIPNCPGRFILNIGDKSLSMSEILGRELKTSDRKSVV